MAFRFNIHIRRNKVPKITLDHGRPRSVEPVAEPVPAPVVGAGPRLLAEAPLLVGIALAGLLLWQRGSAFVPPSYPMGLDWSSYFLAAWDVVHGVGVNFPAHRHSLYPAMLGGLGEIVGYAAAAVYLSSLASILLVVATGLSARILANPWAGGLAAFSVPFVTHTAEAARSANLYPCLSAVTAAALAVGLCAARWPSKGWYAVAGLAAGVAWGIDIRGLAVLPSVVCLGLIGLKAVPRASSKLVLTAILAAGILLGGPGSERLLRVQPPEPVWKNLFSQVSNNDALVSGMGAAMGITWAPRSVQHACRDGASRSFPGPSTAFDPCGRAIMKVNAGTLFDTIPFGGWATLLCVPLLLIPFRRQRGRILTTLAWLATPTAFLAVFFGWIVIPYNYMAQIAGPLAVIVPVAVARGVSTVPRRLHFPVNAVVFVAAGISLACVEPPPGPGAGGLSNGIEGAEDHLWIAPMLDEIRTHVAGEDVLVDCSARSLVLAMLPTPSLPCRMIDGSMNFDSTTDPLPSFDPVGYCLELMRSPPSTQGQNWMVSADPPMRKASQRAPSPGSVPEIQEFPTQLEEPWTLVSRAAGSSGSLWLWRYGAQGPSQPEPEPAGTALPAELP